MSNSWVGRVAGSQAIVEVRATSTINLVDELISPQPTDNFLSPGFIDLQVNGFAGVDYNDPTSPPEAIAKSIRTMFSTGVTRFYPTLITGSAERLTGALRNLTAARESFGNAPEAAAIDGYHVEGPHISPEDGPRGAHPVEHVRPPDVEEFKRWQEAAQGRVKLVTISPEWPTAPAYIEMLSRSGVVASVGHTRATPEQIHAAVEAGATMSTHLGNGAHAVLPKTASYIWAQLAEDRLSPSFVVDGIHIPGIFLRSCLRAKGVERSVLVTDAVMPTMCPPGPYKLGSVAVQLLENGSVVLQGGTRLAGAALRMDHAIGNTVRLGEIPLHHALALATINAARAGRVAGRQRGLTTGEKADLVRYRWDETAHKLTVLETVVGGVTAYEA